MAKVHELGISAWEAPLTSSVASHLEQGALVHLPHLKFTLSPDEEKLLTPTILDGSRKNISYDATTDRVHGYRRQDPRLETQLQVMMRRYQRCGIALLNQALPEYREKLIVGRTSFRPAEIDQRPTSVRKDDKRLHVDAFPANPVQGKRILRLFANINPSAPRVWRVGQDFSEIASRFGPSLNPPLPFANLLMHKLRLTKSVRTAYDHYMLALHDAMKKDAAYQSSSASSEVVSLSANSTWFVFTDAVPHAVMKGQHILEQTFLLEVEDMVRPDLSPLRILEKTLGRTLL